MLSAHIYVSVLDSVDMSQRGHQQAACTTGNCIWQLKNGWNDCQDLSKPTSGCLGMLFFSSCSYYDRGLQPE